MSKHNPTLLLIFSIVLSIGGCKSIPNQWWKAGATQQELHSDRSFCVQKSDRLAVAGAGSSSSGRALLGLIASNNSFVDCMEELGWQPGSGSLPENTPRIEVSDEEILQFQQIASDLAEHERELIGTRTSYCSIGIWSGYGPEILRLSDYGRKAGFRPGDTVTRIGLLPVLAETNIAEQIRNYGPHDMVEVTIERDSEEIVIAADCGDGFPALQEALASLDAASAGRWDECVFRAHKFEQEIGYISSASAGIRLLCNQGSLAYSGRVFDGGDATLWYEAAVLKIEEVQFGRPYSQQFRDDVNETSVFLRERGFDLYANDIDRMLAQLVVPLIWK